VSVVTRHWQAARTLLCSSLSTAEAFNSRLRIILKHLVVEQDREPQTALEATVAPEAVRLEVRLDLVVLQQVMEGMVQTLADRLALPLPYTKAPALVVAQAAVDHQVDEVSRRQAELQWSLAEAVEARVAVAARRSSALAVLVVLATLLEVHLQVSAAEAVVEVAVWVAVQEKRALRAVPASCSSSGTRLTLEL